MEMTKKQAEFWVAILVLCLFTAVAILLVDFGIKASILEESNKLRLTIEEETLSRGQKPKRANENGNANDISDNPPLPGNVLVDDTARMEARNVPNGATPKATNSRPRRAQSSRQNSPRTIPGGDK